jgi:DNA-binding NarL/FixJ family response regulator
MTAAPIRILLVDDHATLRNGLRNAIAEHADLSVVGEAATWREALDRTLELRPGVLVLDLNLPDGNGWTLLEQLATHKMLPPTLILSACDEHTYARRLLRSGARGYLMKDEPLSRVIEAIRQVHQGIFVASPTITNELIQTAITQHDPDLPETSSNSVISSLSDRELQIFTLLGQGWRNKEIADRLGLGDKTVSTYKARLMEKLSITTTMDLLTQYRALGLAAGDGA